ncbi:hypothetical protein TNCV_3263001 [Trichonephila clavipes]|nr:hypothetical protein TNCV_3263001 [Trichonephila clavipes]
MDISFTLTMLSVSYPKEKTGMAGTGTTDSKEKDKLIGKRLFLSCGNSVERSSGQPPTSSRVAELFSKWKILSV